MSEEKTKKNPYVQCIKCRNLWYAVGILSTIGIILFGYVFFDFASLINILIVWDLFRYIGLATVGCICGYISFDSLKKYCNEKIGQEYRRSSEELFGACICIFIVLLAVAVIGFYLPMTMEEYQVRQSEDRLTAIENLSCKTFMANINGWSVDMFELYDWDNEHRLTHIIYSLDNYKTLDIKYGGCR